MKRRICPECELRFKSKARRIAGGDPVITCPRCGHIIEAEAEDD